VPLLEQILLRCVACWKARGKQGKGGRVPGLSPWERNGGTLRARSLWPAHVTLQGDARDWRPRVWLLRP
jgi:hypothetical protein